jgi:DNA-binding transcriptional MerR regulator
MNRFTIKDIENLSGIKAHTLRIWEQRYGLLRPSRTDTNIRYYDNEDLKKILRVAFLNKHGYKISRIDKMSDADMLAAARSIHHQTETNEWAVQELIEAMADLDLLRFESVIDQSIAHRGLLRTANELFWTFFDKVGFLWMTGSINPAQEHLTSNIIRQKLLAGIDALPQPLPHLPAFLLYLPEGELHEMGLLYICYLLRSQGIPVIYLGANIPAADVDFVFNYYHPAHIYIHLTSVLDDFDTAQFLTRISGTFAGAGIYLSGKMLQAVTDPLPAGIQILRSFEEVAQVVDTLYEH